jgi:hypothetical protein
MPQFVLSTSGYIGLPNLVRLELNDHEVQGSFILKYSPRSRVDLDWRVALAQSHKTSLGAAPFGLWFSKGWGF